MRTCEMKVTYTYKIGSEEKILISKMQFNDVSDAVLYLKHLTDFFDDYRYIISEVTMQVVDI